MFHQNDMNPLLEMREQHQLFEDSRGSNKSFIRLLLDRIVPALSRKQKTKDEEKALETDAGANERLPAQHLGSTVSKPGNQAPPDHADPILESARPSLFWTIWQKHDRDQPKKHVLNIAAMQSVVVRRQQESLVAAYRTMLEGKKDEILPGLIHEYCTAIRDAEFIDETSRRTGFDNNPFLLQTSSQLEREIMQQHGLMPKEKDIPPATDRDCPRLAPFSSLPSRKRYFCLGLALASGAAFLVPTIVMKLVPYTMPTLITTSFCIMLFSVVLAWKSSLKPHEIFVMTAAYAAVLVIFVSLAPQDEDHDLATLLSYIADFTAPFA